MTTDPRPMTADECRDRFLRTVARYVDYWERESRATTDRAKLEGLAFGLLVILDGGAGGLPGFKLIPAPCPEDEEYHRERGENWWPAGVDIAGALHEHVHRYFRGEAG